MSELKVGQPAWLAHTHIFHDDDPVPPRPVKVVQLDEPSNVFGRAAFVEYTDAAGVVIGRVVAAEYNSDRLWTFTVFASRNEAYEAYEKMLRRAYEEHQISAKAIAARHEAAWLRSRMFRTALAFFGESNEETVERPSQTTGADQPSR